MKYFDEDSYYYKWNTFSLKRIKCWFLVNYKFFQKVYRLQMYLTTSLSIFSKLCIYVYTNRINDITTKIFFYKAAYLRPMIPELCKFIFWEYTDIEYKKIPNFNFIFRGRDTYHVTRFLSFLGSPPPPHVTPSYITELETYW